MFSILYHSPHLLTIYACPLTSISRPFPLQITVHSLGGVWLLVILRSITYCLRSYQHMTTISFTYYGNILSSWCLSCHVLSNGVGLMSLSSMVHELQSFSYLSSLAYCSQPNGTCHGVSLYLTSYPTRTYGRNPF